MYSVVMMMAMSGAVDLPERRCSCSCSCRSSRKCNKCSKCSRCSCSCYGCYGCHSYHGCHGCHGGIIVVPGTSKSKTKKMTSGDAPAIIRVSLPADATLTVDGAATTSRSAERVLQSPPLAENQEFVYTLRAEIIRDGRTIAQTQRVTVRGGEETSVPFSFATSEAVSSR